MGAVISGVCASTPVGVEPLNEDSDRVLEWHIGSLGYCAIADHFELGRSLGKGAYGHVR
jgi:hypothetical protein